MKLRTSFFNGTVLRKDITRFAPVWALYTVFLLLCVMLLQSDRAPAMFANNITEIMSGMVWVNLLYAGLCATLLFGDLFNARMCNALHAMPMRREGWFLTHVTAGALFAIVPNLIAALAAMALLQKYYYMALIWLAVTLLQYLFFFGAAVFSCLCAGNRLAMVAIYGIINFLAGIIYWLATLFYQPLLYGVELASEPFEFFTPASRIEGQDYVLFKYGKPEGGIWGGFVPESWYYLYGIAAIGVVFLVLSLFIYRRRKLESAGDFISLRPCAPVFLVIYTLIVAALLYSLANAFSAELEYIFLAVGLLIGFFTGKMLLDRTVKVFRPKVFLGFAVLLIAVGGSLVLTWLDPLGISWYVPETEEIQSVALYNSNDMYKYEYSQYGDFSCTAAEDINTVRDLHRQLMQDRGEKDGHTCQIRVVYQLKDGSTVRRYYTVAVDSELGETLRSRFSAAGYVLHTDDWDSFIASIAQIEVNENDSLEEISKPMSYVLTDPEDIRQLMEAVKQDCEAGTMIQDWSFHQEEDAAGWLYITTNVPVGKDGTVFMDSAMDIVYIQGSYTDLTVFESCLNTVEFIKNYIPAE